MKDQILLAAREMVMRDFDHAQEENFIGFNAIDSRGNLGLLCEAVTFGYKPTENELEYILVGLQKYRKQLESAGIELPHTEKQPHDTSVNPKRVNITFEKDVFHMNTDSYDKVFIEAIKPIKHVMTWLGDVKTWECNQKYFDAVYSFVTDALPKEYFIKAIVPGLPEQFPIPKKEPDYHIGLSTSGSLKVRVPYAEKDTLKKVTSSAVWDGNVKAYICPVDDLAAIMKQFPNIIVDENVQNFAQKVEQQDKSKIADFESWLANTNIPFGLTLLPNQIDNLNKFVQYQKLGVFDDMGLGKTLTATMIAKYMQDTHGDLLIIFVSPKSVRSSIMLYAKEAKLENAWFYTWTAEHMPRVEYKTKGGWYNPLKAEKKIKYYRNLPYRIIDPKTGFTMLGVGENTKVLLVADEAHYAGERKSQRSKAILELSKVCDFVIPMTGTPKRRGLPHTMIPILQMINHPLVNDVWAFINRYCDPENTRFGLKMGASNLEELHQKLYVGNAIRHTLDLKVTQSRIFKSIDATDDDDKRYNTIVSDLWRVHNQKISDGLVSDGAEQIVELTIHRQAASQIKIQHAVDLVMDLLHDNHSVVVFTAFSTVAEKFNTLLSKEIADSENDFNSFIITGSTSESARQSIMKEFQDGNNPSCLVGTSAIYEGVTLTKATYIVFIDRDFTPEKVRQAERRIYRTGQTQNCVTVWLQYGLTDVRIDTKILERARNANITVDGIDESLNHLRIEKLIRENNGETITDKVEEALKYL